MNNTRKRTGRIRADIRKKMQYNPFSQEKNFQRRASQNKVKNTMLEMWENYLTFNALEL